MWARKLEWDGDLDGASRSLKETIQTKGPSPMRLDKLGRFYVLKGEPQESLSHCDQAVALSKGKVKYQSPEDSSSIRMIAEQRLRQEPQA